MEPRDRAASGALYSGNLAYLEGLAPEMLEGLLAQESPRPGDAAPPAPDSTARADVQKQIGVLRLINAYRFLGVREAELDPLQRFEHIRLPELSLSHYGLERADLAQRFDPGTLAAAPMTLADILDALKKIYRGHVGVEYMHITDPARKRWVQSRLEADRGNYGLTSADKRALLKRLTDAEILEQFLHTRYPGQKRFSLEGSESLIPLLDHVIRHCAAQGAKEIVMGMAHRGRINVLANVLGRPLDSLFAEPAEGNGPLTGDVKYHQGFSADVGTPSGPVHVAMAFNPSHLEIIHPAVRGSVRARQDRRGDMKGFEVVPVILHGDAALAGQGVVMESLNMSQTRGFRTGGAIHIVINNQIGFTTSDPRDVRSTLYCTDVAKMVEAPVFHVNGDDPEAMAYVARLAVAYRYVFHKNVFIDLVCFRRHGHNEQDEPLVTQPLMYRLIAQHPGARAKYAQRLQEEGLLERGQAEALVMDCREKLERGESLCPPAASDFKQAFAVDWGRYKAPSPPRDADTRLDPAALHRLGERLTEVPAGFALHRQVEKVRQARLRMLAGKIGVDWGMAENLAYASLLAAGYGVRLSGQDSGRGTFAHRHAVWHDQNRQHRLAGSHTPLESIAPGQGLFTLINTLLSEEAVLAFEYGYATAEPDTLDIWEAQYGDFANGAQVVIDQFITSGEAKWGRLCGLTLMLPHGYEGQGPEHSSARPERYLQLAAQDNIQICVPSTAAQLFHVLRRQMLRPVRKPLVLFTPKSLLRLPESASPLAEFTSGGWRRILDDPLHPSRARRVVMCTGRVYYDLRRARREAALEEAVALVRVEELYPFPESDLKAVLESYAQAGQFVWCQEEPQNQGAWYQTWHHLRHALPHGGDVAYAGRPPSAAPASGYASLHQAQLAAFLREALDA